MAVVFESQPPFQFTFNSKTMSKNKQFNLVKELAEMQEKALKKHNIHFVTIPKHKPKDKKNE
jgi:hypothetical protein